MKKIYLLLLFAFFAINSQALDVPFNDFTNLPAGRSAAASANDGAHIYVVNGFTETEQFTSSILKFTVLTNSWTELTSLSLAKRFASAAIIGDKLYVFNGVLSDGTINNKLEIISLSDGSITFGTDNPQPVTTAGVSVWNGKIYSFGGGTGGAYSNKLYEYNPQTNLWTELAPMPVGKGTKGKVINGKLYVIGGYNGAVSDKINIYDIATDNWESEITMPMGISANALAVRGSEIYSFGDYSNQTLVVSFDTADNSFTQRTSNMYARRHCVVELVYEQFYAIGGNTQSNIQSALSSVQGSAVLLSEGSVFLDDVIHLYPNPSKTFLNLNKEFDFIKIVSLNGRVLHSRKGNTTKINVSNYDSGIYFLLAKRKNKWYRYKWIKQ